MTTCFQQHEVVPAYTRNLASKGEIKWSAEFEVPAIGEDIAIRLNGIGRAKVVGYATYCGYLGVMTVPYSPPQWWVWQNGMPGLHNAALVFGTEIAPLPAMAMAEALR